MRKLQKQSVDMWVRWAAERNLSLTRAEVKEIIDKYNDTISQSVPFSGGARLKPNNIKPNHAVGEVYKPKIGRAHV